MRRYIACVPVFAGVFLAASFLTHSPPDVTGAKSKPERIDPKPDPDLSGVYYFRGVEKGEAYTGIVQVAGASPVYRVVWTMESGTTFKGIGLWDGDRLSVGWSNVVAHTPDGPIIMQGVNVYRITKTGLEGTWTSGKGVRTEAWIRLKVPVDV